MSKFLSMDESRAPHIVREKVILYQPRFHCHYDGMTDVTIKKALEDFAHNNDLLIVKSTSKFKRLCKLVEPSTCVLVYSVGRFCLFAGIGRDMVEQIHNAGGWVYSITEHLSSCDDRFFQLFSDANARFLEKTLEYDH